MKYLYLFTFTLTNFILLFSINTFAASEIEQVAPIDNQRTMLVPGESLFERCQYWSSSVVQIGNEPYFTLSTRSTSLKTQIHHDLFFNIFGKGCNKINIFIYTNSHVPIENIENQFGQILFDGEVEYGFRFLVKTFHGSNVIGFRPGDIDALIELMQKHSVMFIELPSINKRISYDLRGFLTSFRRASQMCMHSIPRYFP